MITVSTLPWDLNGLKIYYKVDGIKIHGVCQTDTVACLKVLEVQDAEFWETGEVFMVALLLSFL